MHKRVDIFRSKAIGAAALLLTLVCLASCASGTSDAGADAPGQSKSKARSSRLHSPERKRPTPQVGVMVVEAASSVSTRSYVGSVNASKSVRLSARYSGRIESLKASEGRRVEAGEVLAVISSETVKSTLKTAQATYDYAKDGLERAEKVHASGTVTEQKIMEIRSEFAKAEAALAAARQALEECTIRAPFAGVIGSVEACEGENVSVMQGIATLLDISSLEIEISVPEAEMPLVKTGDRMKVCVPALGNASFTAVLRVKGITASPISHSYSCTLAPLSHVDGLLPGMVCSVAGHDMGEPLVAIPPQTVRTDADGRYVWTVRDGRVEKSRITVGGYSGNSLAVTDGLFPGDTLVVEGAQRVSSGMHVDIRMVE